MYLLTEWRGCLDKNLAQEQAQQGLCIVTSKFSFHGSVNHTKFRTGGIVSNLVKATYKFWNQKLTRLNYARLEYWSLRYNSLQKIRTLILREICRHL